MLVFITLICPCSHVNEYILTCRYIYIHMLCLLGPSNAGRMSSSSSATSPQQHQASSADSTPAAATSPAAAPPPSPPPAYIPQPAAPQVRSQPRQRRDAQPPVAAVADRAAQCHSQRMENLKKEHEAKMTILAKEEVYMDEEHRLRMEIMLSLKARVTGAGVQANISADRQITSLPWQKCSKCYREVNVQAPTIT